jgi:spermidine synthase
MTDGERALGLLTVCEFWGASHIDSVPLMERVLPEAVTAGRLTLKELVVHEFEPIGISAVAILAESHLSIHTWPEHGYLAVDLFTCSDSADVDAMLDVLRDAFTPERVEHRSFVRGSRNSFEIDRFEEREPGSASHTSYDIERSLDLRRSKYQEIALFTSPRAGRVLALDGIVQMTDLDTFVYHEMLAHPALFAHPAPKHVAIVGGGDLMLAAEVLKHPDVETVHVHELDGEIVEVATAHYDTARAVLGDPRVELHIGDAFETIPLLDAPVDVVMIDLTDPIGAAARLFEDDFYALCDRVLSPNGFVVAQTESVHFHPDVVAGCFDTLARRFEHTDLLWTAIATYPGAFWTFVIASHALDPRVVRRTPEVETGLYDSSAHEWFFVPAPVRRKLLGT